jgi:hypothetical protein
MRSRRTNQGARLCALALAVAATFAATPAAALSLGSPDVSSFLGQPLVLRVPVVLDDSTETSAQCLRVIGQPGGEVPSLALARIDVERGATGSFLRVSTAQPIDEPVLRVVLEIGCTQRVRREFTLLLDPPAGIATGAGFTPQGAEGLPPLIEFGQPQVAGVRGQPLLVNVPISGELARTLTSACVRTGRSDSAELPRVLNDARVTLIDREGGRALRIHTPEPVNDGRVRVIVEVGCDRPVRREFVVEVDAPRLAATGAEEATPAASPVPVRRPTKPPVRAALPPAAPPAPAPVVAPPPVKLETPSAQQAEVRPIEPPRLPPPAPPAPTTDRLVLSAPEDKPQDRSGERDVEVLKRVDELSAEIKKLRAELDVTARRNRELAEKADAAGYAWAAAAVAALLLGLGIVFGWRGRPPAEDSPADVDRAGPMTRILGKSAQTPPVPPGPLMTEGAGPATIAAIAEAHRAHEQDTQGASTAIMVTEMRDTTQVLGELYSPYIERGPNTQPGPPTKTEIALDLDLGQERTTVFSPQTKTEIAVDIDVFERNSQIGRDLQREYERLDLLTGAKPAPTEPSVTPEPDPATLLGGTTMPMTTKLALDLDLDLNTVAQPKPKKDLE